MADIADLEADDWQKCDSRILTFDNDNRPVMAQLMGRVEVKEVEEREHPSYGYQRYFNTEAAE